MATATGQRQAGVSLARQQFAGFRSVVASRFFVVSSVFCPEPGGASLTMEVPSARLKRSGRDHSRQLACVCLRSLFYSARFATDTSQGRLHVCTFRNGQGIVAVNYATDPGRGVGSDVAAQFQVETLH